MDQAEKFREQVLKMLTSAVALPKKDIEDAIEKPPEGLGADLALPCFLLAKKLKKDPREIANEVSDKLNRKKQKSSILIKAVGPYVNFYADWCLLSEPIIREIHNRKGRYGSSRPAGRQEKVMTEYAHPNTHKSFHIGHVRNICLGESISRILEFSGKKVVRANYQGDIGPHVAKCLWGFMNYYSGKAPKAVGRDDRGKWLGDIYTKVNIKAKDDEKIQEEVRAINTKLYDGDKELRAIWKDTRQWSLDYYDQVYKDFGAKFNRLYFESEVEKSGKLASLALLKKGLAKESQGAVVMNYERDGLGVFILLTQDGNPLYGAKDLGLAKLQVKEYKPNRILHIVGTEQNTYFRQLFKTFNIMDKSLAKKEFHICYELVNLPTGKMSSRTGTVITYDELKSKLMELASQVTTQKNPKLKGKLLDATAKTVALGALKYSMLMVSPEKTITFDWDRALSFEGNSAPYIQYSHARASSILRKSKSAKVTKGKISKGLLNSEAEIALVKHLAEFPTTITHAARDLRPHYVANYAYELATRFNNFYEKSPVINADNRELKAARLALVRATTIVLENALGLLGIDAPDEM
jgi:arginyl-tRNA synthetase